MHRFYVNRLARFSSPDPVPGGAQGPQSLDLYSYVANDPWNRADPTGRQSEPTPPPCPDYTICIICNPADDILCPGNCGDGTSCHGPFLTPRLPFGEGGGGQEMRPPTCAEVLNACMYQREVDHQLCLQPFKEEKGARDLTCKYLARVISRINPEAGRLFLIGCLAASQAQYKLDSAPCEVFYASELVACQYRHARCCARQGGDGC